jgi:hypothetical protein
VTNEKAFAGYLLYAYGVDGPLLRSGGEPSNISGFQSRGAEILPLRRSGGYEAEVKGNYNREGWLVGLGDDEWWRATNLRRDKADLYSIAHHEIGHALAFNGVNPRFRDARRDGAFRDDRLRVHLEKDKDPAVDSSDHFPGTIDPASLRGAFGNEYHGRVPRGRWLITRADLIAARAVGYHLRATSALAPLAFETDALPPATAGASYTASLHATGGIPAYHWQVIEGSLPPGLALDPFTGELLGTPERPGAFDLTIRVRDSEEQPRNAGPSRRLRLDIIKY